MHSFKCGGYSKKHSGEIFALQAHRGAMKLTNAGN